MTDTLKRWIAERRRIAEAATPGPWKLEQGNQGYRLLYSITNAYGKNRSGCDEWQILHWHDPLNGIEQLQHRDADVIVDQRNCMSILLQIVEIQDVALNHISSDTPKCVGCVHEDVSLLEHYMFEAKQAVGRVQALVKEKAEKC